MELKILIRTPKGHATKTEKRLRFFILKNIKPKAVVTNDLDNELCWIIEGKPRYLTKLTMQVTQWRFLMTAALNNKLMRKVIKKKFGAEGLDEVSDMLLNQTEIDVIKEATAEELAKDEESVFHKIKNMFK